MQLNVHI